jgi:hypothetical protein
MGPVLSQLVELYEAGVDIELYLQAIRAGATDEEICEVLSVSYGDVYATEACLQDYISARSGGARHAEVSDAVRRGIAIAGYGQLRAAGCSHAQAVTIWRPGVVKDYQLLRINGASHQNAADVLASNMVVTLYILRRASGADHQTALTGTPAGSTHHRP